MWIPKCATLIWGPTLIGENTVHKYNVIFNKTVTKLVNILIKFFFHIWTLQATLIAVLISLYIHHCWKGKIQHLFIKRTQKVLKIVTDQLVYCQTSQSCMNGSCLNKCQNILKVLYFSKYQCEFRKGFSVQHCLVSMLKKWNPATDNKKSFGALLTGLSKAFDCLTHDLLIAK